MLTTGRRARLAFLVALGASIAIAVPTAPALPALAAKAELQGRVLGRLALGGFHAGATGSLAWDPGSRTVYSTNAEKGTLDLVDLSDPAAPVLVRSVDVGGRPRAVAVHDGIVAVAVRGEATADPGHLVLLDLEGKQLGSVEVGVDPAAVAFTPRGTKVITANEGTPSEDYTIDPEGSVTVVDLVAGASAATATPVHFTDFDAGGARADELATQVRITGPGASVAQDLEPVSVAVSADGDTAYVSLQENDALAVIDVGDASVSQIVPLRSFDFGFAGLDPSGADGGINIEPWPVLGMYQPAGLAAYQVGGDPYLVSANEGALRDLPGFSEVKRVADLTLDPDAFLDGPIIQTAENVGDLLVSDKSGDTNGDGDFDLLFAAGARSFTIWDATSWEPVFDSEDDFEQTIADQDPDHFNSSDDAQPSFDQQSRASGPRPKGLAIGQIGSRTYAFIGLEEQGGVMVYDISKPARSSPVTYLQNRDWKGDPAAGTAGDLGPDGLLFVPAVESPTGGGLVLVANAVSGTLTVWGLSRP